MRLDSLLKLCKGNSLSAPYFVRLLGWLSIPSLSIKKGKGGKERVCVIR